MPTHWIRAREPKGGPASTAIDTSTEAVRAHLEDAAHFAGGRADGVARPGTETDIAALLGSAARVLPVGAQSSVTGGATPQGGLVISTTRMTSIQESGQHHVRAGAGVGASVRIRPPIRWDAR